jgi:hypothetical protein
MRVVIVAVALIGCGQDDWARETEMTSQGAGLMNDAGPSDQIALDKLVRDLPTYYKVIGAPVPSSSLEAILAVSRRASVKQKARLKHSMDIVAKGVGRTITHAKERRVVPYPPLHNLIAYAKLQHRAMTMEPGEGQALFSSRAERVFAFIQDGQNRRDRSRGQVVFNALYLAMSEFFQLTNPALNSKMLALEFLEREPFEPRAWAIEVPELQLHDMSMMLTLRDAVVNGVGNLDATRKARLIDLLNQYITLLDEVDAHCDSYANLNSYLSRIAKLLDRNKAFIHQLLPERN